MLGQVPVHKVTDLSSFLVQLRQLLLMFDPHLSHFLLQRVAATRVSTRTETQDQGMSGGGDTGHRQTTDDVDSPGIVSSLDLILVRLVPLRQNCLEVRLLEKTVIWKTNGESLRCPRRLCRKSSYTVRKTLVWCVQSSLLGPLERTVDPSLTSITNSSTFVL